jgi:hypothetical protein
MGGTSIGPAVDSGPTPESFPSSGAGDLRSALPASMPLGPSGSAPGPYQGHYQWGADYYSYPYDTATASDLRMWVAIPDDFPEIGGLSQYWVGLSALDSANSYDQIGFYHNGGYDAACGQATCLGTWWLVYGTTTPCETEYYDNFFVHQLTRGAEYLFDMSVASGVVTFTLMTPLGVILWDTSVVTGGNSFPLEGQPSCTQAYGVQDYEEVWDTPGPVVPYDISIYNFADCQPASANLYALCPGGGPIGLSPSGGALGQQWEPEYESFVNEPRPPFSVDIDSNIVTIQNEPYDVGFLYPGYGAPNSPNADTYSVGEYRSEPASPTYVCELVVNDWEEGSSGLDPIYLSFYHVPTGWTVSLSPGTVDHTIGFPEVFFSFPAGTPPGQYYIGINATDATGSGTYNRIALNVSIGFVFPYLVVVRRVGLPLDYLWAMTVGNETAISSNATHSFTLPNGTYNYSIYRNPIYRETSVPLRGTITVNGTNVTEPSVAFALVSYSVTLSEQGLPAGRPWSVSVNGTFYPSTNSTVTFAEPNGTYELLIRGPKGFQLSGSPGDTRLVVNGTDDHGSVAFRKATTGRVAFAERGLEKGSRWCVVLGGLPSCTTQRSVAYLNLTPGSYSYEVESPLVNQTITATIGREVVSRAGTLNVTRRTTVGLSFVYPYAVTFSETGLANSSWSVTVKGVTKTAPSGVPIVFQLPNGTYGYRIGAISGFVASESPKKVHVPTALLVAVTFAAVKPHSGVPISRPPVGSTPELPPATPPASRPQS